MAETLLHEQCAVRLTHHVAADHHVAFFVPLNPVADEIEMTYPVEFQHYRPCRAVGYGTAFHECRLIGFFGDISETV